MVVSLTPEQLDVAEAPSSKRQLVTAGPGTGKTHTLIARLEHLVDEHGVAPGHILVLSFSRSAVGEIRRRLRGSGARYVRPLTFDSFATRLLASNDPTGKWDTESYDGRIARASELVSESEEIDDLSEIEHLCVDEIQDLVGVRRLFVQGLLVHLSSDDAFGFTLLGDPAQGIYNFQLGKGGGTDHHDGSTTLYRWLRAKPSVQEKPLTINHRAHSLEARVGLFAGTDLRRTTDDHGAIRRNLTNVVRELPEMSSLEALRPAVGRQRSIGILSRTNGEALVVSRELDKLGISHRLQRQATDRCVQPWLGRSLTMLGDQAITRRRWLLKHGVLFPSATVEQAEARWTTLLHLGRDGQDSVSLRTVAQRLRRGQIPDDLHTAPRSTISVSTIHRAKGLEFDHVVLVQRSWSPDDEDAGEEARVLFVALTRAVHEIHTVALPDVTGWLRSDGRDQRWSIRGFKRWQRQGFEVRPSDIESVFPPGHGLAGRDPHAIQERLAEGLASARDVRLQLHGPVGRIARYALTVDDDSIGSTTEQFGWSLRREIETGRRVRWPVALTDLRLDGVSSVGGDVNTAAASGLRGAAGWLVPRPVGMSKIQWR